MTTSTLVIIVIIGIVVYFIPSMVAWNKKHSAGIIMLNLFLGWTFLGWLASLIWACSDPEKPENEEIYIYTCDKCGYEQKLNQNLKLFVCPNCKTEYPLEK
jgi:hypothetical protein